MASNDTQPSIPSIKLRSINAEELLMNSAIRNNASGTTAMAGTRIASTYFILTLTLILPVHDANAFGGRIQPTDCWEIRALVMPGGEYSAAYDINDSGQVIGTSHVQNALPSPLNAVAFISAPNGGALTPIVNPDSPIRLAPVAVNNAGQVVGYYPAFVTDPGGANVRFTLSNAIARDINNAGQTLWDIESPYFKGVIGPSEQPPLSDGSGLTEVAVLPSWVPLNERYQSSNAMNDFGQVAVTGVAYPGGWDREIGPTAYRWSKYEGAIELVPGADYSYASAINDRGQVAGVFAILTNGDRAEQAFVTRPYSTELVKLGVPDDGNTPSGINNFGQLVGIHAPLGTYVDSYVTVPFFVHRSIPLNTLREVVRDGWTMLSPAAINNRGQIAGSGLRNGSRFAFILTPLSLQAYLPTRDGAQATCYRWQR
jgi:uncharacterized membrane protein